MKNFEFPKTLPHSHIGRKGVYNRTQQTVKEFDTGETKTLAYYAFYEKELGFGFTHALEIETVYLEVNKQKTLIRVKTLASTCKMKSTAKTTYLICSEDYYRTVNEAVDALLGKTKVYKPKRKPEPIRAMTIEEIKDYWGREYFKSDGIAG